MASMESIADTNHVAIVGWMSNCRGGGDSILNSNWWLFSQNIKMVKNMNNKIFCPATDWDGDAEHDLHFD